MPEQPDPAPKPFDPLRCLLAVTGLPKQQLLGRMQRMTPKERADLEAAAASNDVAKIRFLADDPPPAETADPQPQPQP